MAVGIVWTYEKGDCVRLHHIFEDVDTAVSELELLTEGGLVAHYPRRMRLDAAGRICGAGYTVHTYGERADGAKFYVTTHSIFPKGS